MGHEAVRRGAVPVLLAGLEEDAVAGADDLDRAAAPLAEADALGDVDRLAVRVGVPGGARAGREVDVLALQPRGARGRGDGVDVDGAGEPVARALVELLVLHVVSSVVMRSGRRARVASSGLWSSVAAQLASRSQRLFGLRAGLGGVDEHRQPGVGESVSASKAEAELADDRVVEALGAGVVEADVVGRPARRGTARSRGQLADEVRELAVVRVSAGFGAQDGDGVVRDALPVDVEVRAHVGRGR